VIVNAAYRYGDWRVCADGAANVALAATSVDARLVHISSDALHGGRPTPYLDDDVPTPVNPYGAAKAAAETAVSAIDPSAAIIRTSLLIGDDRSKQIQLALDLLAGRPPFRSALHRRIPLPDRRGRPGRSGAGDRRDTLCGTAQRGRLASPESSGVGPPGSPTARPRPGPTPDLRRC
jgi:nucleoside-diphosphate-sugar epimerase